MENDENSEFDHLESLILNSEQRMTIKKERERKN